MSDCASRSIHASLTRFRRVIAGAMAGFVVGGGRKAGEFYFDTTKVRVGDPLRGVVGEKILGAEFVADGAKRLIELGDRGGVIIFAAGVFGKLNQCMFAAGIASGAGFDGDVDNAVDDGFGLLGGTKCALIVDLTGGVAAVCDHNQNFSALAIFERLSSEKNSIVKRSRSAGVNSIHGAIDGLEVGGEGEILTDDFAEIVQRQGVNRADYGMGKAAGGGEFERKIFTSAQAGINVEHDRKRQFGFFSKDRNFLQLAIFKHSKVFFGQIADG